ncbi:MAG: hypothetical protein B7Y61_11955, partial [Rhizobiales bacterium 35-66-30]
MERLKRINIPIISCSMFIYIAILELIHLTIWKRVLRREESARLRTGARKALLGGSQQPFFRSHEMTRTLAGERKRAVLRRAWLSSVAVAAISTCAGLGWSSGALAQAVPQVAPQGIPVQIVQPG